MVKLNLVSGRYILYQDCEKHFIMRDFTKQACSFVFIVNKSFS